MLSSRLVLSADERLALQFACWCAAFWAGVAGSAGRLSLVPYLASMVVSAAAARGLALFAAGGWPPSREWLSLGGGATLFGLPVGFGAVALLQPRGRRLPFIRASLETLALPSALARLGCIAGACCTAAGGAYGWVLAECAGWLAVHAAVRALGGAAYLVVGGCLRVLLQMQSDAPASTFVFVAAGVWIAAGCAVSLSPALLRFRW